MFPSKYLQQVAKKMYSYNIIRGVGKEIINAVENLK
jgi:hypothetical protein